MGLGLAYHKRRLVPILAGVWARGASKENLGPLLISAIVEASYFKFSTQLEFGTSLPKTTSRTKIGGGVGQGSIQNIWDPLHIFATVVARFFKFGTQIGFGTDLPKKRRLAPKLAGVWARGTHKKLGPFTYFCNR